MDDEMPVETAETALVPVSGSPAPALNTGRRTQDLPVLVTEVGPADAFVWDEFFAGGIRNPHTRAAYERAVRQFLAWCSATVSRTYGG